MEVEVYDLVVVGAGPAGSAAALAALSWRPHASVLLLDRAAFPRDKTCGDGISPEGVDVLAGLAVANVLHDAAPIARLRIDGPGGASAAGPTRRTGYVLPRAVFDARLVAAAVARGATLLQERVTRVEQCDGCVVVNGRHTGRTVVGADGAESVTRRMVGAGVQPHAHNAVALRAYAPLSGRPDELLFRFLADPWPAYGWSFPTARDEANVGVISFDGRRRMNRAQLSAALARALPDAEPWGDTVRGHRLPLSTARPSPTHGRVLLAGDAAALVNPLTGEGIYAALLSGSLAGACAVTHPDAPGRVYRAALSHRLRRHLRHTGVAARAFTHRDAVELCVAAAARSPRVLDDVAELALGTGPVTLQLVSRVGRTWIARAAA